MFSPDCEPHPSVAEIKYLQQPVDICTAESEQNITLRVQGGSVTPVSLRIRNRYVFRDLTHLAWSWQLVCDRCSEPILEGEAATDNELSAGMNLSSGVKKVVEMEKLCTTNSRCRYFLNIQGVLNDDQSWAGVGHILVSKQIPVYFSFAEEPPSTLRLVPSGGTFSPLRLVSNKQSIHVFRGGTTPLAIVDRGTGALVSVQWTDRNILSAGSLKPNYTRATTDNDRGGIELVLEFMLLSWARPLIERVGGLNHFSHYHHWEMKGVTQDSPPKAVCDDIMVTEETSDVIQLDASCRIVSSRKRTLFRQSITYRIHRNGRIQVSNHVVPDKFIRNIPSLPRVGLSLQLEPALDIIEYYGRGPFENYPDRKSGSHMGFFITRASDMGYDYIVPSENGSRSDCDWAAFRSSNDGDGMLVVAESGSNFSFSALLHSADEINSALHSHDLDEREIRKYPVHVNIDHKLMGLGGDVSWFPCVYTEFLVKCSQEYDYR
jgi:beta-galactosidase